MFSLIYYLGNIVVKVMRQSGKEQKNQSLLSIYNNRGEFSLKLYIRGNYSWLLNNTGAGLLALHRVKNSVCLCCPSLYVVPPYHWFHLHRFNQPRSWQVSIAYIQTRTSLNNNGSFVWELVRNRTWYFEGQICLGNPDFEGHEHIHGN